MDLDIREILRRCDHTLLRRDCGESEIAALCDEALRYGCASVCIPPCHVAFAKAQVGDKMKICTVIGFPNGYSTTAVKVFEAQEAIRDGADEIDMVVNLCLLRDGKRDALLGEICAMKAACGEKVLKVIVETCLLSEEEKLALCDIVSESGADFIKTSTGFSTGGATREDVRLLRENCSEQVRVKAAGGIATMEDAADFVALGADRLGTSRVVKLAIEQGY